MKDIRGYEGIYAVCEDGKIWAHPRTIIRKRKGWKGAIVHLNGHWMKTSTTKKGDWYYSIAFGWGNSRKGYKVHRLVAQAFIPNPNNLPDVNHKNGDKTDNRVKNLEWVTRRQNLEHGFKIYPIANRPLARGEQSWCAKLKDDDIPIIRMRFKNGELSQRKLAKEYGVSHTTIKGIINGWTWKHVH